MDQQKKLTRKEMRIDFEGKIGKSERLRQRVFSLNFLGKIIWSIFRLVLLVGISYIILYPFITKIAASFMSPSDFTDQTVKLISKHPSLDQWIYIIKENNYWTALFNTARISLLCGVFQTLICAIIGYGFAKFKFKGRGILFVCVLITMIIPHDTILLAMFMRFRYLDFDAFNLINIFTGKSGFFEVTGIGKALFDAFGKPGFMNPTGSFKGINSEIPLYLLSLTGLAFKNGLYIFIFRQFYRGVPDELEEAAYIDGTGVFETYFRIIMPLSTSMMTTVFMFAFSWQWTDTFYTASPFFTTSGEPLLANIVNKIPPTLKETYAAQALWESAITNTSGLLVIIPLFIIFLFAQRSFVEGIERSGIVG